MLRTLCRVPRRLLSFPCHKRYTGDMNDNPDNANNQEVKPQVAAVHPGSKKWVTLLLALLIVIFAAGGGYLWMELQDSKDSERLLNQEKRLLQQQVEQLQTSESSSAAAGTEETACTYSPSTSFTDNIKAALDSKNTAAFATYVTNPVKYVLAASEYGGNRSADEAATALEYTHSATGPWAFVETSDYGTGDYGDYFGENTLILKAESGMVVALEPNCDGSKISEIFVAPNEDLL